MRRLSLHLLGTCELRDGTQLIAPSDPEDRALLVYLAIESNRGHDSDLLARLCWPELEPAQARARLSDALRRLQHIIGSALSYSPTGNVQLAEGAFDCDVTRFHSLLDSYNVHRHRSAAGCRRCASAARQAVGLFRGPLLAGFSALQSPDFVSWIEAWRERLDGRLCAALDRLAVHHARRAEYDEAIGYLRRRLELEPWHEEAHRLLMECLAYTGQRSTALTQFTRCRQALATKLHIAPSPETVALARRIETGTLEPMSMTYLTLPAYATPLVGREKELTRIAELLDGPDCRLVTLIGVGGSGKTRLAVEAAAAARGSFADGVVFVALTSPPGPDRLAAQLGHALGIPSDRDVTLEIQLVDYLREKDLLLLIDNCEQWISEIGLLATLIEAAPGLVLLCTSREPLRLTSEWRVYVSGLAVPPVTHRFDPRAFPAVQLFLQAACRAWPDFRPEGADLSAVASICRAVDGNPLAIALAATQVQWRSPVEIMVALNNDLSSLDHPLRDLPLRHRSLRAVFDSSWRLLSPTEQQILAACAVFRGSFTTTAVAAVCAEPDQTVVSAVLNDLAERSLMRRVASDRYEIHGLVHGFAGQQLGPMGIDRMAIGDRHAAYFLGLVALQSADLNGPGVRSALDILLADLDDIRAAWQWTFDRGILEVIGGSIAGLAELFRLIGLFGEGVALFAAAEMPLNAALTSDPGRVDLQEILGRLQIERASMEYGRGDYESALIACEAAISHAEASGLKMISATGLSLEGWIRWRQGRYKAAINCLYAALSATAKPISGINAQRRTRGSALHCLGMIAWNEGDIGKARRHLNDALALYRSIGHYTGESDVLNNLGMVDLLQGDYIAAESFSRQALDLHRTIGHLRGEGHSLNSLAVTMVSQGEYAAARAAFTRCLAIRRRSGDRGGESIALSGLGALLIHQGRYAEAHVELGRALTLSHTIEHRWAEAMALIYSALLAHLQGDPDSAERYARTALAIAESGRDINLQGYAWTNLGHALAATGRSADAGAAYRRAIELRRRLKQRHLTPDPLAGLLRLALAGGEDTAALAYAEAILQIATDTQLDGVEEPIRVYLSCFYTLQARGDRRAATVLDQAYALFNRLAASLDDPTQLPLFRSAVAANRELLALWDSRISPIPR